MKIKIDFENVPFLKDGGMGKYNIKLDKRVRLNSKMSINSDRLNKVLSVLNGEDRTVADDVSDIEIPQAVVFYRFVEFLAQMTDSMKELSKMKGFDNG